MTRPDESPPDALLVEAARARGAASFDPLVKRYYGMVFTLALGRLGAAEAAEDLAQEVFLRAWLHLDRLDNPARFAGWITRMTRNLAADWARRSQVRSRLLPMLSLSDLSDEAIPDPTREGARDQMETRERSERIQEAVLHLPADLREIVLLRFMERLKTGEIARQLEIDPATVRRRLARGVEQLREAMERDLSDGLEGLRPSRRAAARASRLVLAASVLSAGAKASLAAASGDTAFLAASSSAAPISAVSGAAAGKGGVGSLFHILKSIPASMAGGGVAMGSAKGVALAAAVIVLAIGGIVYLRPYGGHGGDKGRGRLAANGGKNGGIDGRANDSADREGDRARGGLASLDGGDGGNEESPFDPSRRIGPSTEPQGGDPSVAGGPPDTEDPGKQRAWDNAVADYLKDHPQEAEGLEQLVRAMKEVFPNELLERKDAISKAVFFGWTPEAEAELGPLLDARSEALEAARKAAEAPLFHLPPQSRIDDPFPNFLEAQYVNRLMLLDARRLEQQGNVDEAVWETVLAARFSERFRSPSVCPIDHLIGMAGTSSACRVLASSLQDSSLSPETLQRTQTALAQLEKEQTGIDNSAASEAKVQADWLRGLVDRPEEQKQAIAEFGPNGQEAAAALEEAFRDYPAYEREQRESIDLLIQNIRKPYWERTWYEESDLMTLAPNPVTREFCKSMMDASIRSDTALTRLRLCQALCAARMGRDDIVAGLIDPFTGEPFRVEGDRIYSLGPDRRDQGGVLPYDPVNGARSTGDLSVLLDKQPGV